MLFFEGSEKKANIIVDSEQINLLTDVDNSFWTELVNRTQAKIISSIQNQRCKAFLLSESSLFVWQDRVLIITCGVTQLINAIEFFLLKIPEEKIKHVLYQRKNEYFAKAQLTTFGDDLNAISKIINGKAYRFGELHSHHNYLFHQDNNKSLTNSYHSYEFIAYQIDDNISANLTKPNLTAKTIHDLLNISNLIPDFEIDDNVFEPFGYSLNAIKGSDYLTIHVTPQSGSSYVSFESNLNLIEMAPTILKALSPNSFDILCFNESNFNALTADYISNNYIKKADVMSELNNGCLVNFSEFIKLNPDVNKPFVIDLNSPIHAL